MKQEFSRLDMIFLFPRQHLLHPRLVISCSRQVAYMRTEMRNKLDFGIINYLPLVSFHSLTFSRLLAQIWRVHT